MNRRLPVFFFFILFTQYVFAQVGQKLYYKDFRATDDSAHADYYREMTAINGDTFSYTEYHKDGTYITATGKDGMASPVKTGAERYYYKNGKLAILNRYSNNGRYLSTTGFYPNGVMMYVVLGNGVFPQARRLTYDADSSGNVHIINGNGRRQEPDSLFIALYKRERYIMEGPHKDGLRDGLWKGKCENGEEFEEVYKEGRLKYGSTQGADGKKYRYTARFQNPDFGENLDDFEQDIIPRLKNSNDTAGLVFIKPGYLRLSYTINEAGRIVNIKGIKKDGGGMVGLELKRPLPAIEPEKIRGIPVACTIGDNMAAYTRNNFKGSPFQTDLYFNGHYKPPKQ